MEQQRAFFKALLVLRKSKFPKGLKLLEIIRFRTVLVLRQSICQQHLLGLAIKRFGRLLWSRFLFQTASLRLVSFAFGMNDLTRVVIGSGVTLIRGQTFGNCPNLERVEIGVGVAEIETYAFYKAAQLNNVVFPNNEINIAQWAFAGCEALTSVQIPDGSTVHEDAFPLATSAAQQTFAAVGCPAVEGTSLYVAGVTMCNCEPGNTACFDPADDDGAAGDDGTTDDDGTADDDGAADDEWANDRFECNNCRECLETGSGHIFIPRDYFAYGNVQERTEIGDSEYGDGVCATLGANNNDFIVSVKLHETFVSIGSNAFKDALGLTTVYLPAALETIGSGAFSGCTSLRDLYALGTNGVRSGKTFTF